MPYDSWSRLHSYPDGGSPAPFRCPVCRRPRKVTPHKRKIFLVAERLSWNDETVSTRERERNERLTWEVNYELGILDPTVEDPDQIMGGKRSQVNKWHPYQNEFEMKQAFNLIFQAEDITQVSWSLWIGLQMDLQKMLEEDQVNGELCDDDSGRLPYSTAQAGPLQSSKNAGNIMRIDLTHIVDDAPSSSALSPTFGMPTPPSSFTNTLRHLSESPKKRAKPTFSPQEPVAHVPYSTAPSLIPKIESNENKKIISYKTLQDFYCLLDQIERTSWVGALFLEAYAEHLSIDMCRDCWLKRNIVLEE